MTDIARLTQLGLRSWHRIPWQLPTHVALATKQPWAGCGSEPLTLQARLCLKEGTRPPARAMPCHPQANASRNVNHPMSRAP